MRADYHLARRDAYQVPLRPHDEHVPADRRRRHADFAHRIRRQQLELAAGFDDEDVAIFTREIDAAVGRDGGCAEPAALGLTRDR